MTIEVRQFAITVPAGTLASAPQVTDCSFPVRQVDWIEWDIPPGPSGFLGFWIGSQGQPIIPFQSGPVQWITGDNRYAHWDLTDQSDSGSWQVTAYNTGIRSHTVYVRFGLSLVGAGALVPSTLISGSISAQEGGNLGSGGPTTTPATGTAVGELPSVTFVPPTRGAPVPPGRVIPAEAISTLPTA